MCYLYWKPYFYLPLLFLIRIILSYKNCANALKSQFWWLIIGSSANNPTEFTIVNSFLRKSVRFGIKFSRSSKSLNVNLHIFFYVLIEKTMEGKLFLKNKLKSFIIKIYCLLIPTLCPEPVFFWKCWTLEHQIMSRLFSTVETG